MFAVVFAAVLIAPIADVTADLSSQHTVSNETFSAETDTWVNLDQSSIVGDSETIEWFNSSSSSWETLSSSEYAMDYDAGEVNVSSGGDVSPGDNMRASYDYQTVTGMTATVMNFIPLLVVVLILGVLGSYVARSV